MRCVTLVNQRWKNGPGSNNLLHGSRQGGRHDRFEGNAPLLGGGTAVLVLWLYVYGLSRPEGDLDGYVPERRPDFHDLPLKAVPLDRIDPYAYRGRLLEYEAEHRFPVRRPCEDCKEHAGPGLLHLHGSKVRVERPCCQEPIHEIARDL